MENGREFTPEEAERYFKLEIDRLSPDISQKYSRLLLDEQLRAAKNAQGKPQHVPLETREELLELAKSGRSIEDDRLLISMEHDYKTATSKDGRPPIGGAQDD
jgi:hypothetical protein